MRLFIVIAAFFGILIDCNSQITSDLDWIIGSWVMKSDGFELTETWSKADAGFYAGKGVGLSGKDTVFFEEMQIVNLRDTIFYMVKTTGQNGNKSVPFKLVNKGLNTFVFENLMHDFPSVIVYRKKDENHLEAWIEGHKNGLIQTETFEFERK
jgi:hypothetical protein